MDTQSICSAFTKLFRGRGDVWGHDDGFAVRDKITDQTWSDHLQGTTGIGIYPSVPTPNGPICAWGCTDIDVEDIEQARLLHRTLQAAGVVSWIERSRSKGYHVWIFSSSPVSAEAMRNMQLVAHQVADLDPKEVNPKQVDVTESKIGNYVRLPYLGGLIETPERRVIIDHETLKPIPLESFLHLALKNATSPDHIQELAGLYKKPVVKPIVNYTTGTHDISDAMRKLSPLGYVIWRDGPLPGNDRSRTLVRLAYVCHDSNLTPQECRLVVVDADRRWGKYAEHPNGDNEIDKIIHRVYS